MLGQLAAGDRYADVRRRSRSEAASRGGITPGDGPQEVHVVLFDNGRTRALADEVGRQALRCIRCSACLNVCPVYERTGGHAYGSVYPGPTGAILNPLLKGVGHDDVTGPPQGADHSARWPAVIYTVAG